MGIENKSKKTKIKELVKEYKRIFPDEYKKVIEIIKVKRGRQKNKFASLKEAGKTPDIIERQILEYPETLNNILMAKLTPEESLWLQTKKGVRWFATTFNEFSLAEKI